MEKLVVFDWWEKVEDRLLTDLNGCGVAFPVVREMGPFSYYTLTVLGSVSFISLALVSADVDHSVSKKQLRTLILN